MPFNQGMARCNQADVAKLATWIAAAEHALAQSPGVTSVSVDGQSTTWDRRGLMAELDYARKRLGRLMGTRPIVARINLE